MLHLAFSASWRGACAEAAKAGLDGRHTISHRNQVIVLGEELLECGELGLRSGRKGGELLAQVSQSLAGASGGCAMLHEVLARGSCRHACNPAHSGANHCCTVASAVVAYGDVARSAPMCDGGLRAGAAWMPGWRTRAA